MEKCLFLVLLVSCCGFSGASESVVFPEVTQVQKQPVNKATNGTRTLDPRFGSSYGFGIRPTGDGGVSGSFSSSFSGEGNSGSQSFSFQAGAQGFSASQSSSQASTFNTHFPGHYRPSMSGSQSSSISAGPGGGAASSAASQAAVIGGVAMTNSQSASTSFNHPGFARKSPGFVRKRPAYNTHLQRQPPSDIFVFPS